MRRYRFIALPPGIDAEGKDLTVFNKRVTIEPTPQMGSPSMQGQTRTVAARTTRQSFDFGDGLVRAARHGNPDGSAGGWVADTAHVDATAYLAPDSRVFGNARVFGDAQVLDAAMVFDNAKVGDGARVMGRAHVFGVAFVDGATVSGVARVLGMAQVSHGGIVTDQARVNGEAKIRGGTVAGRASVTGRAWVNGARIDGDLVVDGDTVLRPETAAISAATGRCAPKIDDLTDSMWSFALVGGWRVGVRRRWRGRRVSRRGFRGGEVLWVTWL